MTEVGEAADKTELARWARVERALSRRTVLAGGAMVGLGVVGLTATPAEAKMKPELAKYQDTPKGEAKCDGCSHWQAPDACKVVDGKISPEGWCQLFAKKA